MRITECYVEKFGKLTAYKVSFTPGVNSFIFENGYGKTTLTAFIRAMLYGMSDTKRGDLYENERKHYLPWSGGAAGGWLSFEANGKAYRVERSFGTKASQDSFAIFELATGKPTSDFSENLGKELFGIDKDGFERTVFLSERNLSGETDNKTISEKLGGLSGVDGDVGAMDDALKLLEERRKFYYKKGGNGEIYETEKALKEAKRELDAMAESGKELTSLRGKKAALEEQLSAIAAAKTEAEKIKRDEVKRAEREMLKKYCDERAKEKDAAAEKLGALDEFFASGIPSHEEISAVALSLSAEINQDAPMPSDELLALDAELKDVSSEKIAEAKTVLGEETGCKCKKFRTAMLLSLSLVAVGAVLTFLIPILGVILLVIGMALSASFAGIAREKKQKSAIRVKKLGEELGFCDGADIAEELVRIESMLKRKEALDEELSLSRRIYSQNEAIVAERRKKAEEFLSKYPTKTAVPIDEIRANLHERELLTSRISALDTELKRYSPALADGEIPIAVASDGMTELIDSEGTVTAELRITERRIREIEENLEAEYALASECELLAERLDAYKKNFDTIVKTKAFLERARDNLTAKYLGKTKAAFLKYASTIGEGGDFSLDTSFKLTKYEDGATRDADAFSEGTRNSYYLSVRLALVDALYENESPFLIFDDPFASFDDERLASALNVLRMLGKERQILYFAPTEARKI